VFVSYCCTSKASKLSTLEAFKVLDQRIEDCKFIYKLKSEPAGKKVKKMLVPDCLGAHSHSSQFTCFTGDLLYLRKSRRCSSPTA